MTLAASFSPVLRRMLYMVATPVLARGNGELRENKATSTEA